MLIKFLLNVLWLVMIFMLLQCLMYCCVAFQRKQQRAKLRRWHHLQRSESQFVEFDVVSNDFTTTTTLQPEDDDIYCLSSIQKVSKSPQTSCNLINLNVQSDF